VRCGRSPLSSGAFDLGAAQVFTPEAFAALLDLDGAILGRRVGDQGAEQALAGGRDLVDRALEGLLVRLGGRA
jgi:hypothetical protein